jgi:hypothetical protein
MFIPGGPKVGIQYTMYYILYTVYPLLAHLIYIYIYTHTHTHTLFIRLPATKDIFSSEIAA